MSGTGIPREPITRRDLLGLAVAAAGLKLAPPLAQSDRDLLARQVPSSGETLPVIGLGSWITFNVGNDRAARAHCGRVIRAFVDGGGRMIDSSPMCGSSHSVIGEAIASLPAPHRVFSAEKVWTSRADGRPQIEETRRQWRVQRLDLVQVHNLSGWEHHLPTLFAMKRAGRIRINADSRTVAARTSRARQG